MLQRGSPIRAGHQKIVFESHHSFRETALHSTETDLRGFMARMCLNRTPRNGIASVWSWYAAQMRPQPLIAVTDVEASSRWYQRLLGCRSNHGGSAYEQLVSNGQLVLQLHSFEVEHHHGPIGNRDDKPYGNGVLLWFEVDDFEAVVQRSAEMGVEIVIPRHRNPPDGNGGPNHWECWMRDPDGYIVVVASPYGT